jgi:hypothetical protein
LAEDRFALDDLLVSLAETRPAAVASQSLVKRLMEIDYGLTVEEEIAQIGQRMEALRALEAEVHRRIVTHADLRSDPPPPEPPPSVAREFVLLMAVRMALQKLDEVRAALSKRLA